MHAYSTKAKPNISRLLLGAILSILVIANVILYSLTSTLSPNKGNLNSQGNFTILRKSIKFNAGPVQIPEQASNKDREIELRERALVHKCFWKIYQKLNRNETANLDDLSPEAITGLKAYFTRGRGLWESRRFGDDTSVDGDAYDWRAAGMILWTHVGGLLYPNLLLKETKRMRLGSESFTRDLNKCPGSFMRKCVGNVFGDGHPDDVFIFFLDMDQTELSINTTFVFRTMESPYKAARTDLKRPNDLLSSYWRGSALFTPYESWTYYDPNVRSKAQSKDYSLGRTGMAYVFVSHCYTVNARLDYIYELKKHLDVDVYGECSKEKLRCGSFEQENYDNSCFDKMRNHRFYLAFENANCRDYITEKFYLNGLGNDVIPVVLGAHPADYRALAPQGSYILAEDFENPKALAEYLISLSKNDTAYNQFFQWRGTGELIQKNGNLENVDMLTCPTCAMMWYAEVNPFPVRDRQDFWHFEGDKNKAGPAVCLGKNRWYWSRPNGES